MKTLLLSVPRVFTWIGLLCSFAASAFGQFAFETASTLPTGSVGTPYSVNIVATGGTNPVTYTVTAGSAPLGLTLASNGVLSGTPNTASLSTTFTVRATDSSLPTNSFVEKQFSIAIIPAVSITELVLPAGTVGAPYNATLNATGGLAPYTQWTAQGLPSGLSINNSGVISGTPTAAGTTNNIVITVFDNSTPALTGSRTYSLVVNPGAGPTVTTASLAQATVTRPYSQTLTATGGTGAINWTLAPGSVLPAGLSISPGGVLSGAPSVSISGSTSFAFTVRATDASNQIGDKTLNLLINTVPVITTGTLPNAVVGSPYTTTLQNLGGTAPFTWQLTFGTLPSPLVFTPASATISGTPTTISSTPALTFQLTDANGAITSATFSLVVNPALTINNATPLPAATANTEYVQQFTASGGGSTSYIFQVAPGSSLPPGLTLTTQGLLSGTPTTPGTAAFSIQVVDGSGLIATKAFALTVNPSGNALTITTPTPLPQGAVNSLYNFVLEALGGTGTGYTWSAPGGGLPAGLGLSTAGVLSGTPTVAGATSFTVQVTDSSNASVSKQVQIGINNALLITTNSPLPSGNVNVAYNQTLTASGGTGVYTWAIAAGSTLPAGLTLSPTGVLSGTPTAAASLASFTVQVTDSANITTTKALQVTINAGGGPLTITTASPLPAGTIGIAYTQTISASGGTGSGYSFLVTVGSLPAGLGLATSGLISGTPTAATTATFTVQVTDSNNATTTKQFQLTINQTGLSITTTSLPNWTQGASFSQTLAATGGTGTLGWSILAGGALPQGLQIGQLTGNISGTPTVPGSYSFTVQVTDAVPSAATRQYTVVVNAPPSIVAATLPGGVTNSAYSTTVTASGGTTPYTWAVATGNLPGGLSINANTGTISGTPTATGTFQFTLRVTDAAGAIATRQFSIVISGNTLSINTSTLSNAVLNIAYSAQLNGSGGSGGYNWSITQGNLPAGLGLAPTTGLISGTPAAIGQYPITITLTDSVNTAVSRPFTLTVLATGLVISTLSLPEAVLGVSYSTTIAAVGGSGQGYIFALAPGSALLPPGLNLGSNGQIIGTPTQTGVTNLNIQVTDSANSIATKQFTLAVAASALTISSATPLPEATQGLLYSNQLLSSGGVGSSYQYSLIAQSLPPGLTLSATGLISGTPTQAGLYPFTVQVIDGVGGVATKIMSMNVKAPSLSIQTTSLPLAGNNSPYSTTLQAVGGAAPFVWNLTVGSLPPGLSLDTATGTISGTPTALGTYNFRIQVFDVQSSVASRELSMDVVTFGISTTSLPDGQAGEPYTANIVAVGGSGTQSWSILSGQIPPGLTLSSFGQLVGTPTTVGQYNFTVEARDSVGNVAAKALAVTITAPTVPLLQITTQTLNTALPLTAFTQTMGVTGGTPPYSWFIGSGVLPAGFTLSTSGVLSGTAQAGQAGTYPLGIVVSDAQNRNTSRQFSFVIQAPAPLVITTNALTGGNIGIPYSQALTATGGAGALNWTLASGALPAGLTFSMTGVISGTPLVPGTFQITALVSDALGSSQSKTLTLVVGTAIVIQTASLPSAITGQPYVQSFSTAGGTPPYFYTISTGTLPTGFTLSTAGVLSGASRVAGPYTFTVRSQDSANPANVTTKSFTLTIGEALRISTTSLPGGVVGQAYTAQLQAVGAELPVSWNATGIPDGLTLDLATGSFTGIPARADTFNITVSMRDGLNRTITAVFPVVMQRGASQLSRQAFVPITPCRIMETRQEYNFQGRQGGFGPPSMNGGETRLLQLNGSNVCTIPAAAKAYVLNITLIPKTSAVDYVTVYAGDESRPNTWTVRSLDGQTVANTAIVRAGANNSINVFTSNNADILIDISGYFSDASATNNLAYYPVTPCRAIETRQEYRVAGPYGPPTLNNQETRRFRIPGSPFCSVPANAVAYSATLTVVPQGPLAYLTAWPAGQNQPNVSSINSFAGRVLANNVILPAGTDGNIDVFAFNRTDVLVDINGYFAPDDGTGLYYFPAVSCRVSDTTDTSFTTPFGGPIYENEATRTLPLPTSTRCAGIPASAKGYALTFTVLPNGNVMPFLSAYPSGQQRPNASVLNAFEGQVVTNSTIIPAGTNAAIDVFTYRRTNVVIDILGYFGR